MANNINACKKPSKNIPKGTLAGEGDYLFVDKGMSCSAYFTCPDYSFIISCPSSHIGCS